MQVFFNINSTNATQEDVIYANEYFGSLEYEGPVLWPGDFAIWVRAAFIESHTLDARALTLARPPRRFGTTM